MWRQRTEYIHNKSVRAGIVEFAEDYLYSSARFYYNKKCLIELAWNNCLEAKRSLQIRLCYFEG